MDFAFLNNKINGSIDYYNRKTIDILMDVSVPNEFALGAYKDNVGSVRNNGVELNISYNDRWGDWSFGVAANFAYNKNEVVDLGGAEYLDVSDGYNQRNTLGHAMNSYYIYETDGFFNSQEEADAFQEKYGNPFGGGDFKAGDLRYVDTNGDGTLDGKDRVLYGSTDPVYTFGLNLNAGWKGFDLSLMFNGAAKVYRLFDSHEVYGAFLVMPATQLPSGKMPGQKLTRMLPCRVSLLIPTLRVVHVMHSLLSGCRIPATCV